CTEETEFFPCPVAHFSDAFWFFLVDQHAQSLSGNGRSRRTSRCHATGSSMLATARDAASFSKAAAILSPACAAREALNRREREALSTTLSTEVNLLRMG